MTNLEVRTFWEWDADGVKCGERSYVPKDTYDALAAELAALKERHDKSNLTARIAALESLITAIYAVKPPGDDEWCTRPWSELCDRICELVPSVLEGK